MTPRWLSFLFAVFCTLLAACAMLPGLSTASAAPPVLAAGLSPASSAYTLSLPFVAAAAVEPAPTATPQLLPTPTPAATSTPAATPTPAATWTPAGTYLRTKIDNIARFIDTCPQNDPAYAQIRSDFTIRIDGVVVNDVFCTEPFSTQPVAQLTDPLITLQALRILYYMDPGIPNAIPWTSGSLYDWMKSQVQGINHKSQPDQLYCCDRIDGGLYIAASVQDDVQRDYMRDWGGYWITIQFFLHEARHADGKHPHVTGCPAFPNPTDPLGCDSTYDISDLGAYGVDYWIIYSWMTGYLNVGMACAPDRGEEDADDMLWLLNSRRRRFVTNAPPEIEEMPAEPWGGPCYDGQP